MNSEKIINQIKELEKEHNCEVYAKIYSDYTLEFYKANSGKFLGSN